VLTKSRLNRYRDLVVKRLILVKSGVSVAWVIRNNDSVKRRFFLSRNIKKKVLQIFNLLPSSVCAEWPYQLRSNSDLPSCQWRVQKATFLCIRALANFP
jgi:hypothetical protein